MERIAAIPDLDFLFIGPADLSQSMGLPGQWDHPRVLEAEKFVIETALRKGIAPRAEINHPALAKKYLDYNDYKNDTDNLAAFEIPRIERMMTKARIGPDFADWKDFAD